MARVKRTTAAPAGAARHGPGRSAPGAAARSPKRSESRHYHHGDLRAALLAAAEEELAEKGVEGFTLRGCARRAGVSHAAPAHHFKDVRALLTEMATIAFDRLSASMEAYAAGIEPGTLDYIDAVGRGYLAFAIAHPASFHLLFRSAALDCDDKRYESAGERAFAYPVRGVGAYRGSADPMSNPSLAAEVIGIWSMVHGLADLTLAGQFDKGAGGDPKLLADSLVPALIHQFFEGKALRVRRHRPG